ncbi:MAG: glycosyltransferase family 39 protein [Acidimicrobiales bacterium]
MTPVGIRAGSQADPVESASPGRPPWPLLAAGGLVLVLGALARFLSPSALWLDEALSVNIATLPLGEIPGALRRDGAPPLYYVILHLWILLFGSGDVAVRALSGLFSLGAVPLVWLAARRLGGPQAGAAAALLLASSPFAVRYATEVRMYSLVVLLAACAMLALIAIEAGGGWKAHVALGASVGALLLTHYWALYLVAALAMVLAWWWWNGRRIGRALISVAVGSAALIPWLPVLWFQTRHTGTPWASPPKARALLDTVIEFAGGYWDPGLGLGLIYLSLFVLGLCGRPLDDRRLEIDLRGHPPGTALAGVCALTMVVALTAARVSGSTFAVRYAAVILAPSLVLAALGTAALARPAVRQGLVAVACVLGLAAVVPNVVGQRTSAPAVARRLAAGARPGDVVAYCPDQLGPSVSRILAATGSGGGAVGGGAARDLEQITFPRRTPPQLVNWVDYETVNQRASANSFASELIRRAGPDSTVWVVWAPGYRTFSTNCERILAALRQERAERRILPVARRVFERPGLVAYPPGPPEEIAGPIAPAP